MAKGGKFALANADADNSKGSLKA
ncbi:hypothetical protein [Borreliella valaisiana]